MNNLIIAFNSWTVPSSHQSLSFDSSVEDTSYLDKSMEINIDTSDVWTCACQQDCGIASQKVISLRIFMEIW